MKSALVMAGLIVGILLTACGNESKTVESSVEVTTQEQIVIKEKPSFKEMLRTPDEYMGYDLTIEGTVTQFSGDRHQVIINDAEGNVYVLIDERKDQSVRLLVDDVIEANGTFQGAVSLTIEGTSAQSVDAAKVSMTSVEIISDQMDAVTQGETLEPETVAQNNEYVFSGSSERAITETDMAGLDAETLRIGKNEIYARHGYIFKDSALQKHFEATSWYIGTDTADTFDYSCLSDIERGNIDIIQKEIDKQSGGSNSNGYQSRGLALDDPYAIPQLDGIYCYSCDGIGWFNLTIDGGSAMVDWYYGDSVSMPVSFAVYSINDLEYVSDDGVSIIFDDYGNIATISHSNSMDGKYKFVE